MPIKFLCDQCNSKLQVATRKAGTQQTCPRCRKQIVIPEPEIAEAMLAMKTSDRFSEGWEDEDFLEFALYDDEELVYDDASGDSMSSPRIARVDPDRISLPRTAIYIQGALLGVVACVFFVFGVMAGRFTTSPEASQLQATLRCRVIGKVSERSDNQTSPDAGAMVILLPKDRYPDPRPLVSQLTPEYGIDPDSPDQQLIREIGGAITDVSDNGSFEVVVPSPRDYYLLVISKNKTRPRNERLTKEQRATMGGYFLPVDELVTDREFLWREMRITGSSEEIEPIQF